MIVPSAPAHHPVPLLALDAGPQLVVAGARRRAVLVVALAAACAFVLVVTTAPPGVVADGRRALMATLLAAAPHLTGSWGRSQVELAGNVVLFAPAGLAGVLLARRWRWAVVPAGAALSSAIELVQGALPGRIPDPTDVAANTAGAALGAAVGAVLLGVLRWWARSAARTGRSAPQHRPVSRSRRDRRPRHPRWPAPTAAAVILALATAALLLRGASTTEARTASGSSAVTSTVKALPSTPSSTSSATGSGSSPLAPPARPEVQGDGSVPPEGVSPFDTSTAAVAGLEPRLRAALQAAARDAEDDGVHVVVTSGWRSADLQRALFDRAVAEHGSPEAARKFVLPPERSAHVAGEAVDVGPTEAAYWFAEHGSAYGLCQVYSNEVWHYELVTTPGGRCPAQLPDAASVLP